MKPVLDTCCGSKMFWFDKRNPNVTFCDNRQLAERLCDGRILRIEPDVLCDFKNLPFEDESFYLVVFDPPHLRRAGPRSWQAKKYGKLPFDWQNELRRGFRECFRVLKPNGTLIFKWSGIQIPLRDVLPLAEMPPLFGDRRSDRGRQWVVFMKLESGTGLQEAAGEEHFDSI